MTAVTTETAFGPVETIEISELVPGDFITQIPSQGGIRGVRINSGVRDLRDDWNTWGRSTGRGRPRMQVKSRIIMFLDPALPAVNIPATCIAEVRRIQP